MTGYICIGVPYYVGERRPEDSEVAALRASGIAEEIGAEWVTIQPDFGGAPDPVTAVNWALAQTISEHRARTPIIFASDCTSALGAMKGLEGQHPAILWYDAHGDFNTHETTPSGFLGGMPLAMLVGRGQMNLMNGVSLTPIAEREVILTDARDLDPEEGDMLRENDVLHLSRLDDLLITSLPAKPLYIHFDTDVLDPSDLPGMNYPAPNGPSLETAIATLQHVAREAQVAGILFSLWNDTLAEGDPRSLETTLSLVRAFVEAK